MTNKLCELCETDESTSFHHLIPRTLHSNRWFKARYSREEMSCGLDLCRGCHKMIHELITEKRLGREFNTREKLLGHQKLGRYVQWKRRRSA